MAPHSDLITKTLAYIATPASDKLDEVLISKIEASLQKFRTLQYHSINQDILEQQHKIEHFLDSDTMYEYDALWQRLGDKHTGKVRPLLEQDQFILFSTIYHHNGMILGLSIIFKESSCYREIRINLLVNCNLPEAHCNIHGYNQDYWCVLEKEVAQSLHQCSRKYFYFAEPRPELTPHQYKEAKTDIFDDSDIPSYLLSAFAVWNDYMLCYLAAPLYPSLTYSLTYSLTNHLSANHQHDRYHKPGMKPC